VSYRQLSIDGRMQGLERLALKARFLEGETEALKKQQMTLMQNRMAEGSESNHFQHGYEVKVEPKEFASKPVNC